MKNQFPTGSDHVELVFCYVDDLGGSKHREKGWYTQFFDLLFSSGFCKLDSLYWNHDL